MSKPDWNDAPTWAKILVQNDDGYWFFGSYESANPDYLGGWTGKGKGKWFRSVLGTPSDNWRKTFDRRPIHRPTDDRIDTIGQNGNTGEHYARDEVNNPKHYDLFPDGKSIDIIRSALTDEEWRGFLKGNVLKYRLRAGEKGPADKCLAKSNWYREKLWNENLD